MIDLKDKTILITGASSGIGRAAAQLCDQLGANIIITGRNREELDKTAATLKNKTVWHLADLSSEEEISKLAAAVPALDGFVHCAGIIQPMPIKFLRAKNIDELFRINFSSAVLLSSHLLSGKKINAE